MKWNDAFYKSGSWINFRFARCGMRHAQIRRKWIFCVCFQPKIEPEENVDAADKCYIVNGLSAKTRLIDASEPLTSKAMASFMQVPGAGK